MNRLGLYKGVHRWIHRVTRLSGLLPDQVDHFHRQSKLVKQSKGEFSNTSQVIYNMLVINDLSIKVFDYMGT